jgi:hypothetical protein
MLAGIPLLIYSMSVFQNISCGLTALSVLTSWIPEHMYLNGYVSSSQRFVAALSDYLPKQLFSAGEKLEADIRWLRQRQVQLLQDLIQAHCVNVRIDMLMHARQARRC